MPDTAPGRLRRYGPEIGLFVFITVNALAMLVTDVGQTVPFHFIWISLTLAYGYRTWRAPWTLAALGAVCLVTAASLVFAVSSDGLDPAELTEVPLMAAVFLANIMHARRREAALAQVRHLAAEQERQREKERDFLRDASHLLRTPVTIARGYTELLRATLGSDEHTADTDIILRELDSMTRISNRLLLLTATQLDELLDTSRGDVAVLLQQAVLRWQPAASRTWTVRTETCEVVGDLTLLESALDALIENAVRHTTEGGTIALRCRRQGSEVLVDVSDDGEGIPAAQLPGLFERKWRPRTPGERTGSGLGLAIVKAIATAHGGDVEAGSGELGGARFTVHLPAAATEPATAPTPAQRRRPVAEPAAR